MRIAGIAVAAVVSAFALAGCRNAGGVEGTYKRDKTAVKKALQAELAKSNPPLPPGLINMATSMIDSMEMTLELQAGGTLNVKSTAPINASGRLGKTEEKEGTWALDGDSVVLTVERKPLRCVRSGATLSCEAERKGTPTLIFVKS